MSFWITNPIKLVEDINVLPNKKQSYDERMNTLTRLILLLTVVLYVLKIKGSLQFLIFGVVLIIILYYSQRQSNLEMSSASRDTHTRDTPSREYFTPEIFDPVAPSSQYPQGIQSESSPIGQLKYEIHNGPGNPIYRRIPIEAPSPAMASEWGGEYNAKINTLQDSVIPQGYSSRIMWGQQSPGGVVPRGVTMLPPLPRGGTSEARETRGAYDAYSSSSSQIGQRGSIGAFNGEHKEAFNGAIAPFSREVSGRDPRFAGGNQYYIHRKVQSSPSYGEHIIQPLNRGAGLEYNPEYRDSTDHNRYQNGAAPTWDPMYVHGARTAYQRAVIPDVNRTGPYRSASILGAPSQYNPRYDGGGDGYREIGDLHGANQYYVTNPDPFAGMFAINTESAHMDYLTDNGTVIPMYRRDGVEVEDYIDAVGERQTADELMFRDSMMESAAAKIAETEFQYAMGPVRHA